MELFLQSDIDNVYNDLSDLTAEIYDIHKIIKNMIIVNPKKTKHTKISWLLFCLDIVIGKLSYILQNNIANTNKYDGNIYNKYDFILKTIIFGLVKFQIIMNDIKSTQIFRLRKNISIDDKNTINDNKQKYNLCIDNINILRNKYKIYTNEVYKILITEYI